MNDKFKNKYRVSSIRLPHWDYGWNAAYFITICTLNRTCFLGDIRDGMMRLSDIGKIVRFEWTQTPVLRPDMNLELGEFVVMPNHFHAILITGENEFNQNLVDEAAKHGDSTQANQFAPQCKNLGSIMRGFKSAVTKKARSIRVDFAWQSRFYEHIIRNEHTFRNKVNYIRNNPNEWEKDQYYH